MTTQYVWSTIVVGFGFRETCTCLRVSGRPTLRQGSFARDALDATDRTDSQPKKKILQHLKIPFGESLLSQPGPQVYLILDTIVKWYLFISIPRGSMFRASWILPRKSMVRLGTSSEDRSCKSPASRSQGYRGVAFVLAMACCLLSFHFQLNSK